MIDSPWTAFSQKMSSYNPKMAEHSGGAQIFSLSLPELNQQVIEFGRLGPLVRLTPPIILGIYYSGIDLILGGLGGSRGVSDQLEQLRLPKFSLSLPEVNQQVLEFGRSGPLVRLTPHIILGIYYSGIDLILGGLGGSRGVSDQLEQLTAPKLSPIIT